MNKKILFLFLVGFCLVCGGQGSDAGGKGIDPLQICAKKALLGHFGKLEKWQIEGYKKVIKNNIKIQGKAWLTSYYPSEGFYKGKTTRSGNSVSEKSAAVAQKRWKTLKFKYVWADNQIRIIEDTGSNNNEVIAKRKGASIWIDFWHNKYKESKITYFSIF